MHPVPIAQPITTAQNDPNFLNLAQPPTPPGSDLSVYGDLKVLPLETLEAGPIALSPPPRRASRQLAQTEAVATPSDEAPTTPASSETETEKAQVQPDVDDVLRPPPEVDDFAPSSSA